MTFTIHRLQFSPSLIPTSATMVMVALTLYLGHWQQGRAAEKRGLQAQYDARASEPSIALTPQATNPEFRYRQAVAEGEWLSSGQVYVDNKVNHEVAGFHVITPLKIDNAGTYVLVNRGWIPRGKTYPLPPKVETPAGHVRVTGLLSVPTSRFLELSSQAVQGNVWQNLTIDRFRDASKLDLLPFVLLASEAVAPLEAVSELPDAREGKHVEYMLTWYSLAAT
ncbi:MAG: SURF1 family protein, partial [Betaproteobacteria bacterium]